MLAKKGETLRLYEPVDREAWVGWARTLRRWQLLGRDVLATTFEGTGEADEFYDAATSGIQRDPNQTDDETFVYQQEAIESAINVLDSLKERIEYAATPAVEEGRAVSPDAHAAEQDSGDKVFVVHGRNTVARDGMFDFLRAIGLQPIDWSEAVRLTGKGSPYIGEVLDAAFSTAKAVIVLMTPDEVAVLRGEYANRPDEPDLKPSGQARPNVLFEAGMALGRDPDRTILIQLGELREFSDIAGRHAIRLQGVADRREIAMRLQTAGCAVDLSGDHWKTVDGLTAPSTPDLETLIAPEGAAATSGRPSADLAVEVSAHYERRAKGQGVLTLTNDGPVDLYDLRFELPEEAGTSFHVMAELPVPFVPVGKSVGFLTARTMGLTSDHFELPVTARTSDGTQVAARAFVNLVT